MFLSTVLIAGILVGCGKQQADHSTRNRDAGGSRIAVDEVETPDESNEHHPMATDDVAHSEARAAIEWLKHDSRLAAIPPDPTGKDAQSERLRREVGAPVGWRTRIVAQRALPDKRRQTVLLFSIDGANDPFRLALAESVDSGSLQIVVEQECGDGFVTYCERTFKRVPTAVQLEQFLSDFGDR